LKKFFPKLVQCDQHGCALTHHAPLTLKQLKLCLLLAFAFLAILLITAGDYGLRRMDRVNADLQEAMSRQWTKLYLSREAAAYSGRNSQLIMKVFLLHNREEIDAVLAERAKNTERVYSLFVSLNKVCTSNEERQQLIAIERKRNAYIASYKRALHLLVDENRRKAAEEIMVQETTVSLWQYHAAWGQFLHYEEDQMERAIQRNKENYVAARWVALLVIIVAVVVPCLLALFFVRRLVTVITTRLRDEKEALQTAHEAAEVFINAVPSILIGVDQKMRITRWNLAATEAFGLSASQAMGKGIADCGIKWLAPGMQKEIESWKSVTGFQRCDQVPFEVDGATHLLGITITQVEVTDEGLTKFLVIASDITTQNVMEEQLRQAQKLESIGQLASGIAHEINTPTQYIGDNVQFLKDAFQGLKGLVQNNQRKLIAEKHQAVALAMQPEDTPEYEPDDVEYLIDEIPKAIDQTLEGVAQIANLVGAMKEFSHPGTKEKIPLDLNHAIGSTITVSRNEWKYVAEMETDFDPSLPMVSCLPGEFNQVILNLIVNATHAISDVVHRNGLEKGKILVQTRNSGEWVEIRLQDTGSGIPEKIRSRIFDPFFTTKEIGKGTGQGLAIARSVIVDKHGGSIHFETEEGKGTTFIIRIPHDSKALCNQEAAR
jgi:PAS domain S-box-containing protein